MKILNELDLLSIHGGCDDPSHPDPECANPNEDLIDVVEIVEAIINPADPQDITDSAQH